MELLECLQEFNDLSIIFRIVLAILVGGLIGMERGRKNRPAGLRTYILVCLGAALVMMTNQFVYIEFESSDPVRLGAQVISGIGFLGAGTIVLTGKSQIRGLTTAASLWAAACCGLAIGIGFYKGAIVGGLAIMFTVSSLQRMDVWMHKRSMYLELYVEYNPEKGALSEFLQYAKDNSFEVTQIQRNQDAYYRVDDKHNRVIGCVMTVKSIKKRSHEEMLQILMKAQGVLYIEEL